MKYVKAKIMAYDVILWNYDFFISKRYEEADRKKTNLIITLNWNRNYQNMNKKIRFDITDKF